MSGRTFSPGHDASIDYLRSAKIKLAILATYASLFVDRDDRAMTRRMSVGAGRQGHYVAKATRAPSTEQPREVPERPPGVLAEATRRGGVPNTPRKPTCSCQRKLPRPGRRTPDASNATARASCCTPRQSTGDA